MFGSTSYAPPSCTAHSSAAPACAHAAAGAETRTAAASHQRAHRFRLISSPTRRGPPGRLQTLVRSGELAERAGPLAAHGLAVHLPLLLAADGAGHAERAPLAVLADRDGSPPAPLAAGVPGHLVDLVFVDPAVLALVLLDGLADAGH